MDIIIIITLLALSGAVVLGLMKGLGTSGEKVTVRYIVEVDPIDSDLTSKVLKGNGVYDYSTVQRIGTVSAVSASQAYHKGYDSKGDTVSSPIEGSSVLYITVEAEAVRSETGYVIGNTVINIGRDLELRLPDLYAVGQCVSIEVLE